MTDPAPWLREEEDEIKARVLERGLTANDYLRLQAIREEREIFGVVSDDAPSDH